MKNRQHRHAFGFAKPSDWMAPRRAATLMFDTLLPKPTRTLQRHASEAERPIEIHPAQFARLIEALSDRAKRGST
jgi:hypothetical protein